MQLRQESDSGLTLDIKAHIPENWQPVNDLFQVGTLKVTHCQKCLSVTKHMDRSIDLTVQIDADNPTVTRDLHWGISETMKMEHLMGDNQRFCEKCNSKEDAHVYHYFTSLPKIMILRLQRYNFKEGAIKIQNGVSCAERMSFEKWMSQDYTGPHPTYGMLSATSTCDSIPMNLCSDTLSSSCGVATTRFRTLRGDRPSRQSHYIGTLLCLYQENGGNRDCCDRIGWRISNGKEDLPMVWTLYGMRGALPVPTAACQWITDFPDFLFFVSVG